MHGQAPPRIPFNDLRVQHAGLEGDLLAAVSAVVSGGWYVLGAQCASFEDEFADWLGAPHAVGVGSGTDAIALALRGLGLRPGDEVLVPANTCVPTVAGVVAAGGVPVLADVDPTSLLLDAADAARRVTPRTRGMIPVHLYGHPCPMDALTALAKARGLWILEDCAQAHGARWRGQACGTLGDAAAFSFYPTKNLGALGDAGAVVSADAALADRVRRLRNYGEADKYCSVDRGLNSRLDEMQAAALRVKLTRLAAWNAERAALAARYRAGLAGSAATPVVPVEDGESAWHLFAVRHPDRDGLAGHLRRQGIGTQAHYPRAIHAHPAYAELGGTGDFPHAERACAEVLSLPLYPGLSMASVDAVVAAVHGFRG
jgi:dTDP-4-amino-4,6-dideoxygalactose transaminase